VGQDQRRAVAMDLVIEPDAIAIDCCHRGFLMPAVLR
jgi:hypothetical protein